MLHTFGIDARMFDVVSGTSAGAMVAGYLRSSRFTIDDLWDLIHQRGEFAAELGAFFDPTQINGPLMGRRDRSAPRSAQRLAGSSYAFLASAGLLPTRLLPVIERLAPSGFLDHTPLAERLGADLGTAWPESDTRICVSNSFTRSRVVWRSGDAPTGLPFSDAVRASGAIAGFYQSVRVGTSAFGDPGLLSATNVDSVADAACDLVIVLGAGLHPPGPNASASRGYRRFHRERQLVAQQRSSVRLISAGPDVLSKTISGRLRTARVQQVAAGTYDALCRQFTKEKVGLADDLRVLASVMSGSTPDATWVRESSKIAQRPRSADDVTVDPAWGFG